MSFRRAADRPKHDEHGFTLIEVILGVAILAVAAVFILGSLTATTDVIERVREDSAQEQMVRSCLSLLTQDLMLSRNAITQPWIGQNLIGEGGYPADTLAFVTGNHQSQQRDRPEADAARVVYAKVGRKLVRFVRPNIYTLSEEGVRQTDVADHVAGFNIRYYDRQSRVWIEQWDGRSRKTLPQGFMIELTLQREDEPPRTFTSWLTLPS
ncbi:MAG: type II secretion system protein GspJ [Nitrospiraceae bacterium]